MKVYQRILCTFPGRAGDIGWALPTIRAISESLGHPVDLQIAGEFESMLELLRLQPYLGHVCANPHWGMDTWEAPYPVGTAPETYDRVIHLGYQRWPELPLPFEVELRAVDQGLLRADHAIDLDRPWITVPPAPFVDRLTIGWTDCHFELKYGLCYLLSYNWHGPDFDGCVLPAPGSRWVTEGGMEPLGWLEAAQRIDAADCFLGDCSALHVLAVALGKPCVIVEPMEARLNPIFWPLGKDNRVRLVRGLDGESTFDARHTADTLREVLHAR